MKTVCVAVEENMLSMGMVDCFEPLREAFDRELLETKVLKLNFREEGWERPCLGRKELSIGSTVVVKPPVERFSMKGFMKGRQVSTMPRLSWIVVAR